MNYNQGIPPVKESGQERQRNARDRINPAGFDAALNVERQLTS
jgi:hypothetical protein